MSTYLVCTGTRREIIKMAPVHRLLKERGETVQVLHTGQHDEMAQSLYRFFDMGPDHQIQFTRTFSRLSQITAELMQCNDQDVAQTRPDVVLVQGDTSSALVGAMTAYFRDIPVAHIQAGLRTWQNDPFPEEKHREIIGRLAHWHFPSTPDACDKLLREGVQRRHIHEVGNTVIDAALWVQQLRSAGRQRSDYPAAVQQMMATYPGAPLLLVTAHRRENWGRPIQHIAAAVGALLKVNPALVVVWPQQPNADVRQDIALGLAGLAPDCLQRICLTEPLAYPALIGLLADSHFCLTDSGGIQKEASALKKPVLITKPSTARHALVDAGGALLVGSDPHAIVDQASTLLRDPDLYRVMQGSPCPFGDGHSAERIVDVLTGKLNDDTSWHTAHPWPARSRGMGTH
ncbi:MAG: non-hydrolyzing UDP-N-acetylglucosamine 2-epimerase [Burkholderiales bacterium]